MKRLAAATAVLLIFAAVASAGGLTEAVRNLAENVLGAGLVKSVHISPNGVALVRWESATYQPAAALEVTRSQIYLEVLMATGSVLGRLADITEIRFSIFRGSRMLATGVARRTDGIRLVFSPILGGGVYVPAARSSKPAKTSSGGSGKPD